MLKLFARTQIQSLDLTTEEASKCKDAIFRQIDLTFPMVAPTQDRGMQTDTGVTMDRACQTDLDKENGGSSEGSIPNSARPVVVVRPMDTSASEASDNWNSDSPQDIFAEDGPWGQHAQPAEIDSDDSDL